MWRVAGILAIAHVVLMFASFALQQVAPIGSDAGTVRTDHVTFSMTSGFAGEYLTCLSFLILLLAVTLLGRLLRGTAEVSEWLASSAAAAGVVYVAVTLAGALANLGAALYIGHHGGDLSTVAALVDAHWFAVFSATAVLGVFTGCIAGAVLVSRALPRWVAWTGFVTAVVCVASVPAAGAGAVDTATLVWVLWFVGLGVAGLRGGSRTTAAGVPSAPTPVSV